MSLSKKEGMPRFIASPGATIVNRGIKNWKASNAELNEDEMAEIDQILATCEVKVDRYYAHGMKMIKWLRVPNLSNSSPTTCSIT